MTKNEKLDLILKKIGDVDSKLQDVDSRLQDVDDRLQDVDSRLQNVEKDTKDIKLTLENEICVKLQRIAKMLETDAKELKRKLA